MSIFNAMKKSRGSKDVKTMVNGIETTETKKFTFFTPVVTGGWETLVKRLQQLALTDEGRVEIGMGPAYLVIAPLGKHNDFGTGIIRMINYMSFLTANTEARNGLVTENGVKKSAAREMVRMYVGMCDDVKASDRKAFGLLAVNAVKGNDTKSLVSWMDEFYTKNMDAVATWYAETFQQSEEETTEK